MGTLNPPSDGDDIATVTPLRRREPQLIAVPTVRDPLPAENSVWDTDELGTPTLRRSRKREIRGALAIGLGWVPGILAIGLGWARGLLGIRPRSLVGAGVGLACVAALTIVAVGTSSGPVKRPVRTLASSGPPHTSSTAQRSAAAHSTRRLNQHPARHSVRRANRPVRSRAARILTDARRAAPTRRPTTTSVSSATQSVPSTTATQAPPTPASTSTAGASSTAAPRASTSAVSRPTGPTGSGAAFGPGY